MSGKIVTGFMILMYVGEAKASNGDVYEMFNAATGEPVIEHKGTGKRFALSWSEIIDMAVAAGIKERDEDEVTA